MPRVFITQMPPPDSRKDFSGAAQFGELTQVLPYDARPFYSPARAYPLMRKVLADFCDEDFLLHPGTDPTALAMACGILAHQRMKQVQLLRWDRYRDPETQMRDPGRGYYVRVVMPIGG